jgi:hypothetical protein
MIDSCCEITDCQKLKDKEAEKLTKDGNALEKTSCPPCPPNICYGKINQCPLHTGKFIFCINKVVTSWGSGRLFSQSMYICVVLFVLQLHIFVLKGLVLAAVLPVLGTSQTASAMNAVKSNWNAKLAIYR